MMQDGSTKNSEKAQPFDCIDDRQRLILLGVKRNTVRQTGKEFVFPMYECPKCHRLYTNLVQYPRLKEITYQWKTYTNLLSAQDLEAQRGKKKRRKPNPEEKQEQQKPEIFSAEAGRKGYVCTRLSKCKVCSQCGKRELLITWIRFVKNNKPATYTVKRCGGCDAFYVSLEEYNRHRSDWKLLNPEDLFRLQQETAKEERQMAERARCSEKSAKQRQTPKAEKIAIDGGSRRGSNYFQRQFELDLVIAKTLQDVKEQFGPAAVGASEGSVGAREVVIDVRDFVVRRSVFQCRHAGHALQNIVALVDVIDSKGELRQIKAPAGYCPECNMFFLMERTYQQLIEKGTPVCRVTNEKAYLSESDSRESMRLAPESILMQYGYTVSQEEGLTESRRRKILALLIDYKVLTKSEIIGYLDFFISQRKDQWKYERAIAKWERDIEFVSEYKEGSYIRYGVDGIRRRR